MMPKGQYSLRPDAAKQAKSEAGFTLIEMLVVVAIIGMIALIMTINVIATLKRGRLDTAANQLRSLVESARIAALDQRTGVFVVISQNGDGSWTAQLVADTNGDGDLTFDPANPNAGPDMPVRQHLFLLTNDLAVAPTTAPAAGLMWPGPNNWPVSNGSFVLRCDLRGQPWAPGGAAALTTPAIISITHGEMANGTLRPRVRYDITLSPLWHTTMNKVLY